MRTWRFLMLASIVVAASSSAVFTQQENIIYDEDVTLVQPAAMEYPPVALALPFRGTVVVRAALNKKGRVVAVSAISGRTSLVPACLSNAAKWTFRPNAEKSAIIVYEFRVGDAACDGNAYYRLRPPNLIEVTECLHIAEP